MSVRLTDRDLAILAAALDAATEGLREDDGTLQAGSEAFDYVRLADKVARMRELRLLTREAREEGRT